MFLISHIHFELHFTHPNVTIQESTENGAEESSTDSSRATKEDTPLGDKVCVQFMDYFLSVHPGIKNMG